MEKRYFIFCVEPSLANIMNVFYRLFGIEKEFNGNNALHAESGNLTVDFSVYSRDLGEECGEFIENNKRNAWGHFHGVETKELNPEALQTTAHNVKMNVLHQIRKSNGFIVVEAKFQDMTENDIKPMLFPILYSALEPIKGVLIVDDGFTVINNEGKVLLSDKHPCEVDFFLPYLYPVGEFFAKATPDQMERRKLSLDLLNSKGVFVSEWLPVIETEDDAEFRSLQEVVERTIALFIVSLYSEYLLGEKLPVAQAKKQVEGLIKRFDAESFFSPDEKAYLEADEFDEKQAIKFSWQYECCFVMEWALGLIGTLPYPNSLCDVPLTARNIFSCESLSELVSRSKLRSHNELLEQADFIFRADWACVDARVNQLDAPGKLEPGVVQERHHALNWLIGNFSKPWDEVDIST